MKQKQTIQKISKAKSWLFEKTNKADTPTSRKKKKKNINYQHQGWKRSYH